MIANVKYSDQANQQKANLPGRVQTKLEQLIDELAKTIEASESGSATVDGVAADGSRYYVDFGYRRDPDEDLLFIDPIYFISY